MPVRIQPQDFDLSSEVNQLRAGNRLIGAVVNFVGYCRNENDGSGVHSMELEHYPGMTEQSIEAIEQQARQRWPLLDVLVIHRVGPILPGEQIVLVVVCAAHRGDAFQACEFIMDFLKTQAPFWKKEQTPSGARWVQARSSDDSAQQRWSQGQDRDQ